METHDEHGWVRPVADGADPAFMDPIEPTGRTLRSSIVGGIILVAVIAAAVAGTVIWRNRNGDPFASARSIPADMDFVVTFDALALSDSERLQLFVDAFAMPMVDAGIIDDYPDDLVAAIDDAMDDESGYTLTGDVFPWIGRSASFAMSVPNMDMMTAEIVDVDLLLSVDVRDEGEARAFVNKLLDTMADEDIEVAAAEIGGNPGYRWVVADEQELRFGMVLGAGTLLVGTEDTIVSAIAARDAGLSIAENEAFQDTMSRLPDDAMMSMYIGGSFVEGLADLASQGLPPEATEQLAADVFDSIGIAAGIVDQGVRVNYVMTGLGENQAGMVPDLRVLAGLPDDTLGFVSQGAAFESADDLLDPSLLDGFEQELAEIESLFGIDVFALLESLSGEMTFAVTETRDSFIATATDAPIGLVGAIGLNDSAPLSQLFEFVEDMLAEQGGEFSTADGVTTVEADGQEVLSYSIGDDLFVVGTGTELVANVIAGEGGGLLGSALYQELDGAIAGDGLLGYVDIEGIVNLVPITRDEAAVLAPLRGLGVGGSVSDGIAEMEVLLLVDY